MEAGGRERRDEPKKRVGMKNGDNERPKKGRGKGGKGCNYQEGRGAQGRKKEGLMMEGGGGQVSEMNENEN